MTNNLKIEVLVSNIPEDGSIASQFPSQEYVNQQLAKKANLSPEGRLDPSHAPDYTEIPGLYEHIEDTKDVIEASIANSLQDAKGYTNQQLSTSLQTKADLVNGKIPFDQIPFSADIEDQIQINVENITAVVDQKVAQVVEQVNGVATAANSYTDTKVAENKAYVDTTIGNVIEDVERLGVSKAVTIPTYLTPEAGVAVGTGVAAGAYYNVRSTEDDTMLVEYQNVGGVPTPSGKSYPSASAVASYILDIKESIIDPVTNKASAAKIYTESGKNLQVVSDELVKRVPSIMDFFTLSESIAFANNPAMNLTEIIKRAFATGVKKLNFLDLQMHITLNNISDTLAVFASGDVDLYGNGATFIDNTTYLNNDRVIPLFTLDGGVTSFKSNIKYVGKPVNLATEIGYVGATYVYSKGANKNIRVDAYLENIRYGILAGSYPNPSLGGTKTIRGHLDCKNVGYPIATYLADDIEMLITGEGFHRAHYIAGCTHARMITRTKNYYIAPIPNLYSDAKTGEGTSKGCVDCHTHATDMGSTSYVANGYLMAISLSRADPNTIFDDVRLEGYVKGDTGKAEKLGLATINSSIRTYQPSYPANWDSTIELNNISISGTIDRSLQTTGEHSFSDLYLACKDDVSIPGTNVFPKVKNLNIDVDYFAGTGSRPRGFWWFLDGLQDVANVRLNAKNSGVNIIHSNANSLIRFDKSEIIGVDGQYSLSNTSKMEFINSNIYGGNAYLPPANKRFSNTKVGGAYPDTGVLIKTLTNELTLTGASVTWASALPIHAMILGVTFVITQEIEGTSGLLIGDGTTVSKFISSPLTAAGTGIGLSNAPANTYPYIAPGTRNIVVTARDSGGGTAATFTGGKVKIVVNYIEMPVPTV